MDRVVSQLEEVVPYGGHERKEAWTMYLPHTIHVAALDSTLNEITRGSLLDRVGRCQASLGHYSAAETTHQQVISLREKTLGKEHTDTLTSMNEVGVALDRQGKYEAAEAMHRQTLATREKVLGKEHPNTLTSLYCLAYLPANQHRFDKAAPLYERACAGYSTILGHDHRRTRACRQHYSEMRASQEQDRLTVSSELPQILSDNNARPC